MGRVISIGLLSLFCLHVSAQSKSYQKLYDTFGGKDDVTAVSLSGVLCRNLGFLLKEDVRPPDAVMDEIDHVRLIIIPSEKLSEENFLMEHFKKSVVKDSFKKIHAASNNDVEHLSVFHRGDKESKNNYFMLIEKPAKVFAFEMKGPVEPETIRKHSTPPGWKVTK